MAKKKQRHLTRDEIINQMNAIRRNKEMAKKAPYMGINTVANWVLWKKFGFDKKALVKYDADYNHYVNAEDFDVDALNQRLFDYSGGEYIDFDWLEAKDFDRVGNRFLDGYVRTANADINNQMHFEWAKYMIVMRNIFIDYGYPYEKIEEIDHALAEEINNMQEYDGDDSRTGFWNYWNELRDKVGVEVAKPDWDWGCL